MVLYHHIPPIYGDFGDGGSYCFNHITFFFFSCSFYTPMLFDFHALPFCFCLSGVLGSGTSPNAAPCAATKDCGDEANLLSCLEDLGGCERIPSGKLTVLLCKITIFNG